MTDGNSGLEPVLDTLAQDPQFRGMIRYWAYRPPIPARCKSLPPGMDHRLVERLARKGIRSLYSHQAEAVRQFCGGSNVTVVTPTASGKSLCFNIPVLNGLLKDPWARALYIFPTKALAYDQHSSLQDLCSGLLKVAVCDGDTPTAERRLAAEKARIIITNPDMLHHSILPNARLWGAFLNSLRFLVLDEIHVYRGVFGAHVANIIRRLERFVSGRCTRGNPLIRFITCSGTIANPADLAHSLTGRETLVIDKNGAPSAGRHFVVMDPYRMRARGAPLSAAALLAQTLLKSGEQGIIFVHRRQELELLLTKIRRMSGFMPEESVQGYRGGYLPSERRRIEEGLRRGRVRLVLATNALELGVDIGNLRSCIICGWPGSTASLWQQAGRVGRGGRESLTILLTGGTPIDRYVSAFPEALFKSAIESAFINPDNPAVMIRHIEAANREKPFGREESFGALAPKELKRLMTAFALPQAKGQTGSFSIRRGTHETELILEDHMKGVIGRADDAGVLSLCHKGALYLHNGIPFHVIEPSLNLKRVLLRKSKTHESLYLTLPCIASAVSKPTQERQFVVSHIPGAGYVMVHLGTVEIVRKGTSFRLVDPESGRTMSWGRTQLREEWQARAWWLSLPPGITGTLSTTDFKDLLATIAFYLASMAQGICLCDRSDLTATSYIHDPNLGRPTVYLCETWPGGTGIADALFYKTPQLLQNTLKALENDPYRGREKAFFQALLFPGTTKDSSVILDGITSISST